MKKIMNRVFAILITLAIAITTIPTIEVKAAEGDVVVESVTLPFDTVTLDDTNPKPLYQGAEVVLSSGYENVSAIGGFYRNIETGDISATIWFYETQTSGVYRGPIYIDNDMKSGTYKLDFMRFIFDDKPMIEVDAEGLKECTFIVVNNITDFTAPVISNATFPQKGQTFTKGENAQIEFKADFSDEGLGLDLEGDQVYVVLESIDGDCVDLLFVEQEDGSYVATLDVDELENTEWYVWRYYACDMVGNYTEYYPMEEGVYWNFFVKDETGVCNTERTITLNFYDENDEYITTETLDVTSGEVELAALLDEIPTYTFELGFAGWKCEETGQMLKEGEMFLAPWVDDEFNFYPVAEKRYIEVDLEILDEDGEMSWTGYEEYLIDYDATYQDLMELLPEPPASNGCTFVEWDICCDECELTDIIEYDWVDFVAVYDNRPIGVWYGYIDEQGKYVDEYTVLAFPHNQKVTYADVINELAVAEPYEGMTFVEWYIYGDVTDLTEELPYDWVELEAVYDKYPVTMERLYIDQTDSVKSETITKLYPVGTALESIYEEFIETPPSDASETLPIKSWCLKDWDFDEVSLYGNYLFVAAEYEDSVIVELEFDYIAQMDNHGVQSYELVQVLVDKEVASNEDALIAYCKEFVESKLEVTHYDGYDVDGWTYEDAYDMDDDGYYDCLYVCSEINTEDVITVIANLEEMGVYAIEEYPTYFYVVEPSETIVLPWEYNGIYLQWYTDGEDDVEKLDGYVFTVPEDAVKGDTYFCWPESYGTIEGEVDDSVEMEDENDVLPSNLTLRAILLEKGEEYTIAKELVESTLEEIENLAIYDITLVDAEGILMEQLENTVRITLDVPFTVTEGNTIQVFRVGGDKLIECKTTISGNKVSFETDHFSTYVFVEQEKEEIVPPPSEEENPPASGEENPPAGEEENPPTGGEENPPAGGEENPPAGEEENPPAGGEENPPTGGEENPPADEEEPSITGDNTVVFPYLLLLLVGVCALMVGVKKRSIF